MLNSICVLTGCDILQHPTNRIFTVWTSDKLITWIVHKLVEIRILCNIPGIHVCVCFHLESQIYWQKWDVCQRRPRWGEEHTPRPPQRPGGQTRGRAPGECGVFTALTLDTVSVSTGLCSIWPWSTEAVLSRWGIFITIAKNTLYGSKLFIFILCQKSLGY